MERDKGARGEREWRDFLRQEGFTARRGRQFCESPDSPDVICEELADKVHFEVKRVEAFRIRDAMSQAIGDAGEKMPVVAHRRNHGDWLVVMRAADWAELVREFIR